jgi:phosphate butyryltransferase
VINNFEDLLNKVRGKEAKTIAIAAPEDIETISLVKKAIEAELAQFILVGDEAKTRQLVAEANLDDKFIRFLHKSDHYEAAQTAVEMVIEKSANVIMKGKLHTATFLKAVLNKEKGLNAGKLISQITVCEKVDRPGLLMFTDCAMNISPTLDEKKQIIENAVELGIKLGYEKPKVAALSAVEVVNPAMPDTLDAAALSKMADRGQIKAAVVDGPFAMDNAISPAAAKQKKIAGEVAGNADIVLVPNLQVGNTIHKILPIMGRVKVSAAVMGAKAPIVLTSRADSVETNLLAIALASYIS